jgi:hypothetical protein
MKLSTIAILIVGGVLPAVFGSPSPQRDPNSRFCQNHPNRKDCKSSTTQLPTSSTTSATSITSTTSTPSSSPTPPPPTPGCNAGPFQITSFTWFNSSNNVNCPLASDPNHLCYTGMPTQPPGYGPPDYVSFHVLNVATGRSRDCYYGNPGSIPDTGEPGRAGLTKCQIADQTFVFDFTAGATNGMGGSATADLSVADRASGCTLVSQP